MIFWFIKLTYMPNNQVCIIYSILLTQAITYSLIKKISLDINCILKNFKI